MKALVVSGKETIISEPEYPTGQNVTKEQEEDDMGCRV